MDLYDEPSDRYLTPLLASILKLWNSFHLVFEAIQFVKMTLASPEVNEDH